MAIIVNQKFNTVNKTKEREEENKKRKQEFIGKQKREQEEYNDSIKEMKTRISNQPLLVESSK